MDKGWKMWPDVTLIDGKPAVELEDVKKLGYIFGVAVVALPSGIITAGYMQALEKRLDEMDEREKKDAKTEEL